MEPFAAVRGQGALAALGGEHTLVQLAEQFDVHPNQITRRKAETTKNMASAFDKNAAGQIAEGELKELHAKIDQLPLERGLSYGLLA